MKKNKQKNKTKTSENKPQGEKVLFEVLNKTVSMVTLSHFNIS